MYVTFALLLLLVQHDHGGGVHGPADVGSVSFANSGSAAAQDAFRRGLALLHNFEYDAAQTSFRDAQRIDSSFAMAYWGEAMSYTHPIWFRQDVAAARSVLQRLGSDAAARAAKAPTQRERDYLRTVEILYGEGTKEERDFKFADAMRELHIKYPDDVDATAFYALSILGTAHEGRDFGTYMRAAALLEEVFAANQRHPGVLHYLIHSYDDPVHAPLGLRAARLYGSVAPNASHALHMTSHIFIALGMWNDVIDANQRAVDVFLKGRPTGVPCGHPALWQQYALLQVKRYDEAKKMLDVCRASTVDYNYGGGEAPLDPEDSRVGAVAMMQTFYALDSDRAAEPFAMPEGPYAAAKFTLAYGEAIAAARRKDVAALTTAATRLRELQKEVLAAIDSRKSANPAHRQRVDIVMSQVNALQMIAAGKREQGIALLRETAGKEKAMAFDFGPPLIEKPSFELLAEQLFAMGRADEAADAYRVALERAPGRRVAVEGLGRAASGVRRP
jgi:tetratricopeptide (TPR) repeat protein